MSEGAAWGRSVRIVGDVRDALVWMATGAAMTLAPVAALAGAWTAPEGTGVAILSLQAGEGDYNGKTGPGAARETEIEPSLYAEYGLNDRLTALVSGGFKDYAIDAPVDDAYRGADYAAAGLRARLFSSQSLVWSVQATAMAPGARDATRPAQAGNTGFDSDWRALFGANFTLAGRPSFAEASLGYRTRAGGPPDEWRADFTLGVRLRPDLALMAQSFSVFSRGAGSPAFPAEQSTTIQPSLVYDFDSRWSAQLGCYATVNALNADRNRGVIVALWRRF